MFISVDHDVVSTDFAFTLLYKLNPGLQVSSANNTDHHDITEILLKVALNTIKTNNQTSITLSASIFTRFIRNIYS
jgi:hypothetical protein